MVLEYHIPSDRRRKAMLGAPIIVLEYNFLSVLEEYLSVMISKIKVVTRKRVLSKQLVCLEGRFFYYKEEIK